MVRGQRKLKASLVSNPSLSEGVNNSTKQLKMIVHPMTITNYFSANTNIENDYRNKEENHTPIQPCLRVSPRKHASTLSVLQQTNYNVTPIKSPHKIEMNYDAIIEDLVLDKDFETELPVIGTPQPPKKQPKINKGKSTVNNSRSNQVATVLDPKKQENHKLTDFFPVRRSVRKTKKMVQEEIQKTMENAVLSKKEDGLRVEIFSNKGRGIIATRGFERGEFVVEYAGDLVTCEEAKEREALYSQDTNTGCYMYYFTYRNCQYCVDATPESDRLGRLVNHSRNGNLMTKVIVIDDKPHLVLVAKDNISPGDELTYDYGDRSKESLRHHPWLAF